MLVFACNTEWCAWQVTLKSDDMDLVGDLIQALCVFLNIDDLQVTADFPDIMESLKQILVKVSQAQKKGIQGPLALNILT